MMAQVSGQPDHERLAKEAIKRLPKVKDKWRTRRTIIRHIRGMVA